MLKDMKLGTKLLLSYMLIVMFVVITGAVGYRGIKEVAYNLFVVGDEEAPLIDMTHEMKLTLMKGRNAMEEYKSATSTTATADETKLAAILAVYQQTLDDFDVYAEAILEGKEFKDGTVVLKTDNEKLADLVRIADQAHNNEFQVAAADMIARGNDLLRQKANEDKAMLEMENIFDEVISDSGKVEGMISDEIRKRSKDANIGTKALDILREEVPLGDMANELKISLGVSRIALEEFVQKTDLKELNDIEKRYRATITRFDKIVFAILDGGDVDGTKVVATDNTKIRDAVEEMDQNHTDFQETADRLIAAHLAMVEASAAADSSMEKLDAYGQKAEDLLNKVAMAANDEMFGAKKAGAAAVASSIAWILVTLVLSVTLGIVIGVLIARSISNPITKLVDVAARIANNDLTQKVEVTSRDEIGVLGDSFNKMVDSLQQMVGRIRSSSTSVASAADEISAATDQITKGAQSQASAADETSSSMEQMSVNIQSVAENAEGLASNVDETTTSIQQMGTSAEGVAKNAEAMAANVNETSSTIEQMIVSINKTAENVVRADELSELANNEASSGGEAVMKTVDGMRSINETMGNITDVIQNLGKRSEAIGGIVEVIEEIADQTNLLALNAAIEAARAGDAGKGFAVVADEVRKLAERSIKATKEIGGVIKQVQLETSAAVKATEEGASKAKDGIALADKAGQAITKIVEAVSSNSEIMKDISSATNEQSTAAKNVITAVEDMNNLTQAVTQSTKEQAAGVQQVVKAAENMSEMTAQVKNATAEQKSGGENVVKAIENISEVAKSNLAAVEQLSTSAKDMAKQSESLQELVQMFTV